MAVSLSTDGAAKVDKKFDVEVSDERVCVAHTDTIGGIAVTDVAIEQQSVAEKASGKAEVHFHIAEVAFVGAEIGAHGEVVTYVSQYLVEL